jgi:hypothetical protein
MNIYAGSYPQEKLYVQFDKNVYTPGETIWFKAYLFTGTDPSTISKNFYAELLDPQGNILQRKAAPIQEASAAGFFDIPQAAKAAHLHFRAYTTWMLNFDTAFIYEKDIRLIGQGADSSSGSAAPQRHFQFFPEGGDVIGGLENTVAFKATDQYGLPVNVSGVLRDASGHDILEFRSVHDGMGKFLITPDKNDSLYAVWKDDKGAEQRADFPPIRKSGVVLRVLSGNKKVYFSIARSSDEDLSRLTIIGHMNQELVYRATVNLSDNFMSGGNIPVDKLPSGILQLTVFNSRNQPMAERVVFINNHEYSFPASISVTSKSMAKKGKNVIDIEVPDTLRSNLSVAVTDLVADGKKDFDDNIVSRLLLTGEIRGFVNNPYYYFSDASDSAQQHLDLVMLTHGWRRFRWDQLAAGKLPVIKYPLQDFLSLKAEVLGIDPTKIAKDESIYAFLQKKDSSTQMLTIPRLTGGKFGLTGLLFYDTAKVFYQFSKDRKLSNEAAIVFSSGLYPGNRRIKPVAPPFAAWSANDSAMLKRNRYVLQESNNSFAQSQKVKTLEAVTVKGRQKTAAQKLDELYSSGLFSSGDAQLFDLVDDPIAQGYMDIFNYLQGKVAGLQIVSNGANTSLQWRGSTPSLYLNEMQVDVSQLKNTSVSDIAMVKVFRPGSGVALGGGAGGTIAVYTRKGAENNRADPSIKGLDRAMLPGYSPVRQFYVPDYGKPELAEVEDVRTTLYWNPWVLTDKYSQHVTIQFYNNDVARKLRVILEGINAEGKLVTIEKIIQ